MDGFDIYHQKSEQCENYEDSDMKETKSSHEAAEDKEKIAGTDVEYKFAPKVFKEISNEFEEKQNEAKAKIEEIIATCSEQEVVRILNDYNFHLDIENKSTKSDGSFDQNLYSAIASEAVKNNAIENKMEDALETQESLEKLLGELFEKRSKYESIVKFFLATRKPIQSDITQLKYIVEAYNSLETIDSQLCLAQLKWLGKNAKTYEELNKEDHDYSPDKFDAKLDIFGEELDKVKEKLEFMAEMFHDVADVQEALKIKKMNYTKDIKQMLKKVKLT